MTRERRFALLRRAVQLRALAASVDGVQRHRPAAERAVRVGWGYVRIFGSPDSDLRGPGERVDDAVEVVDKSRLAVEGIHGVGLACRPGQLVLEWLR